VLKNQIDVGVSSGCENFPKYIYVTFFVDGLFTQSTSKKFSSQALSKKESRKDNKIEKNVPTASEMVRYLQESIAFFEEESCVVVRTNNASLFKYNHKLLVLDDDVIPLPSYTSTKIAEQQKFYKIFSAIHKRETILIFLDPDMLLVNDIGELRKEASSFDIAITVRDYVKMPINAGFFAISGSSNHTLVDAIFSDMIDISRSLSTVFADQIALLSVFKCEGYQKVHRVNLNGLKVLCLPASIYNASPRDIHTKITKSTKILHFKGDRKFYQAKVHDLLLKKKSTKAALLYAIAI
jgi:hypothetical protein